MKRVVQALLFLAFVLTTGPVLANEAGLKSQWFRPAVGDMWGNVRIPSLAIWMQDGGKAVFLWGMVRNPDPAYGTWEAVEPGKVRLILPWGSNTKDGVCTYSQPSSWQLELSGCDFFKGMYKAVQ